MARERVQLSLVRVEGEEPRIVTVWVDEEQEDDKGRALIRSMQRKRQRGRLHSVTWAKVEEPSEATMAAAAAKPVKATKKAAPAKTPEE